MKKIDQYLNNKLFYSMKLSSSELYSIEIASPN
jgi:hypothetical protein